MTRISAKLTRGLPMHHIHAGEVAFRRAPEILTTVLGSCVSVTFHCPAFDAFAMCHAQFPHGWEGMNERRYYYADLAVRHLAAKFSEIGARPADISVKLFGGAEVLDLPGGAKGLSVGRQNINAAVHELSKLGLKPLSQDVGGGKGRRIFFFGDTGEVFLYKVKKSH